MKKLALVLGGGAAKGYAHVGVLKTLEKNGIKPDLIVGTSMGALVGGMYAAGKTPDEMINLAKKFNSLGSFSLFSTLFKGNILNIDKVKKILIQHLGDMKHDEAQLPFVSVVTELNTGKECHFDKGLIRDSIMASISIPGLFPSLKIGENQYCDGGMVNNLPEDVAKELMPDAVIVSIDVIGDYAKQVEKLKMKTVETLINAATLMTSNVIKNKPIRADLRITIPTSQISQLDFTSETAQKSIKKGEMYTKKFVQAIKQLLGE
ncbi:MAG: hypothetical protein E7351_02660 [Clostridiales bacterium]|nr:hypothetical protein [Clostridiales bacterium]